MWLDRKWVGKIVSLTPSITLWKTRKSFKEQCTQYCYYHNYFVFLLNYMIIAAYYLLLLFYEITKLQRYWLVNLGAFVKWTHRAQIFLLQLDIFNDFSASSSISTLNLVSPVHIVVAIVRHRNLLLWNYDQNKIHCTVLRLIDRFIGSLIAHVALLDIVCDLWWWLSSVFVCFWLA